ncbi:alpha carbonic anhydrase [Xylogone sp. PMI_703]|nr:alpha carbonic anhydrase [Xylogone sp. PMI_703]
MKYSVFIPFISLPITNVYASCGYGTYLHRREEGAAIPPPKFGYDGLQGPLKWADLNVSANGACNTGTNQSPINLVTGSITVDSGAAYKFAIADVPEAELENLGTTIEVPINGTLQTAVRSYTLKQFHFHSPSEHLVDGTHFDMESHFVFEAEDKSVAVVSFPISAGTTNDPLFGTVLSNAGDIPSPGNVTITPGLSFATLITHLESNSVFRYVGSLTTPPCTEGVDWIISSKALVIDAATYELAKGVIGFNARYPQGEIGSPNLLNNSGTKTLFSVGLGAHQH